MNTSSSWPPPPALLPPVLPPILFTGVSQTGGEVKGESSLMAATLGTSEAAKSALTWYVRTCAGAARVHLF